MTTSIVILASMLAWRGDLMRLGVYGLRSPRSASRRSKMTIELMTCVVNQ